MDDEKLSLTIRYDGNTYDIDVFADSTIEDLQMDVFLSTGLHPNEQYFSNLDITSASKDIPPNLRELGVCSNTTFDLHKKLTGCYEPHDHRQSLTNTIPLHVLASPEININFKHLNEMRQDKKLLILDVDQTLYDCNNFNYKYIARPFLHEFLQEIYKLYDIGIWSHTPMYILENKMEVLGMIENPYYKLLFFLDVFGSDRILGTKGKYFRVKNLQVVWQHYTGYDQTNTVICDDKAHNFFFNPKNGIPIPPYSSMNYNTDDELLNLLDYLKYIAESNNVREFDNKRWRQLYGNVVKIKQKVPTIRTLASLPKPK